MFLQFSLPSHVFAAFFTLRLFAVLAVLYRFPSLYCALLRIVRRALCCAGKRLMTRLYLFFRIVCIVWKKSVFIIPCFCLLMKLFILGLFSNNVPFSL